MLREAREALKSKGIPPIQHRALAELAGYACIKKHRSFNADQTPDEESAYITVVNQRAPIPKETDVAAPSPNEAWQTFLTMIWRPDQRDEQCREVLVGAMMTDKSELGRQIQAEAQDLDAPSEDEVGDACVVDGETFTFEQVADIALMTNKAVLRAVRACEFFQTQVTELETMLSEAATPAQPSVDGQLPSE